MSAIKSLDSGKLFPLLYRTLEIMLIVFTFILVNIYSFVHLLQFADVDHYSTNELEYVYILISVLVLIVFLLWKNRLFGAYYSAWKNNGTLILFLGYVLITLFWSVYPAATIYKLIFLFFTTIAGSYIAVRYQRHGVLNVLTWIAGICSVLSILFVLLVPVGIMHNQPFVGSWVGIFWHRNHTGNLFAFFNMIFLFRILSGEKLVRKYKVILLVLYILSAMMVFGSRSATGVIVFLFLHFVVLLVFSWLKWRQKLKVWHYYLVAGILFAGFVVFVANTEYFFGLLGRTSNMTGRIPLWQDLFSNFYLQKPFFGYGYGALWMQESFRLMLQARHGWKYPVYFADNGFFDILLNNGLVGFLLFLLTYLSFGVQSFRQAIRIRSAIYFFPFLVFLYIFSGNLTYSFLLEVDQFVWLIFIVMLFVVGSQENAS